MDTVQCKRRQINGQYGVLHFLHDSERPILPASNKFKAKALSLISLMMAVARWESMRPTNEQSSSFSTKKRQCLARAPGSVTPRPQESTRLAATPREGPSVANTRNVILSSKSSSVSTATSCTIRFWKPGATTSPSAPPAVHLYPKKRR